MQKKPLASVVVLNWNGGASLKKCIDSVRRQSLKDMEIILVDNGSIDGSYDFARKMKGIRLIRKMENTGSAGGYNTGYENSSGKYVILISHDAVLDKNCIRELVKGMESDTGLGCAEGLCVHNDGSIINGNLNRLFFNTPAPPDAVQKFYPGMPAIIRRSAADRWSDPDYFFYGEDVYCGWLLHLKGYGCKRILTAKVMHEGSPTVKRKPKFFRYLDERNRWMNFLLFYETKNIVKYIPLNVAFSFFKLMNGLRNGYFSSYVKAYVWIVTHPRTIATKRRYVQSFRKVSDREIMKDLSSRIF